MGNDYIVEDIVKYYLYVGECLVFVFGIYYVWYGNKGDVGECCFDYFDSYKWLGGVVAC